VHSLACKNIAQNIYEKLILNKNKMINFIINKNVVPKKLNIFDCSINGTCA
jgi:hypothetical protein